MSKVINVEVLDNRYTKHQIPKSDGTLRNIYAPVSGLKENQWFYLKEFERIYNSKISVCATGFRHKYSVVKNALIHRRNDVFYMFDIANFFDNITFETISHFIKTIRLTSEEKALFYRNDVNVKEWIINFIKDDCVSDVRLDYEDGTSKTHKALVQGSPTSPLLSNLVMRDFDKNMYAYCKENGYTYTRYADDITISSKKKENGFEPQIIMGWLEKQIQTYLTEFVPYSNLMVKKSKTRTQTLEDGKPVKVTGIYIKKENWSHRNNYLSTGRDYNEEMVYLARQWSLRGKQSDSDLSKQLAGKIAWFMQVNRQRHSDYTYYAFLLERIMYHKFETNRYKKMIEFGQIKKVDRCSKSESLRRAYTIYKSMIYMLNQM